MSGQKNSTVSAEKIGSSLLKGFMSFMKFLFGAIGRLFKREIPLQYGFFHSKLSSVDSAIQNRPFKYFVLLIVSMILLIILFFWGIGRAIFVPN